MEYESITSPLLKKSYFFWKRVAPVISLMLALNLLSLPASNAAANLKLGSKFSINIILIFTDKQDALSSECNHLTGKWAKFLKATMKVKNAKGKTLSTTKGDYRFAFNYALYNPMVQAGVFPGVHTIMSYDQCSIMVTSNKIPSSESVYKVTISGLQTLTYSHAEIEANFVNGQSSFELMLY